MGCWVVACRVALGFFWGVVWAGEEARSEERHMDIYILSLNYYYYSDDISYIWIIILSTNHDRDDSKDAIRYL